MNVIIWYLHYADLCSLNLLILESQVKKNQERGLWQSIPLPS